MQKLTSPWSIFAYPVCFALMEWLESFTIQGTFNTIAYSQLHVLPVIQMASFTGYLGVTFIVSLFASTLAYAIFFWQEKKKALTALGIGGIILVALLSYGYARLQAFQETTPLTQIKVGLASVSRAPKQIFNPKFAADIFSAYQPLMENLALQHVELILLPEEAFTVTPKTSPQYKTWFSHFAQQHQLRLIVGVHDQQASNTYNSAWVFDAHGHWIGEYYKRHFVPGVEEGLTPGIALLPFNVKANKAGIGICRDMDYPKPANDYGALGTQILFVPAWDFDVDAKVHASGAWLGDIENGYTLVRAARDGFLSVSTPTGEILAKAPAMDPKGSTLIATAPIYVNESFFAKHPWWFVITLWLLFIVMLGQALLKK